MRLCARLSTNVQEEGHEAGTSGAAPDRNGVLRRLKAGKGTNWEGGVRVAGLFQYLNVIPHQQSDHIVSTMDIFPTLCAFAGVPVPADRIIDGIDLSEKLKTSKWSELPLENKEVGGYRYPNVTGVRPYLVHYCGTSVSAIRFGNFKLHYAIPIPEKNTEEHFCEDCCPSTVVCSCGENRLDIPLLYNLYDDPSESTPLDHAKYPEVLQAIEAAFRDNHNKFMNKEMRGGINAPSQLEARPRPWYVGF